jgi:hypothetical protein
MNKITLNNIGELESLKKDVKTPESIDDILRMRIIKDSLVDNGIENFKEIENMNNISFGHFILIEKILGLEQLSSDEKVKMISPIILRPLNEIKLDNEDVAKEKEHKNRIFDESIGNIYGAFNRFMDIRKTYLYKTYNGVIYGTLDEDDNDEEDEGTSINSGTSAREFHSKRFFWQSMINDVANDNIFNHNKVVELMMHTVMPYLAEKRSLGIVEYLEHKASIS